MAARITYPIVAFELGVVQPVEITVRRGGIVSVMPSDRSNVSVKFGVEKVDRMGTEEEREESALRDSCV
jgi:hypothetical protein